MTGTWINVGAILLGSLIGLAFRRGIPEHINAAILKIEGLAICFIGAAGVIGAMFTVDDTGRLHDSGGLLLLVSLVTGCLAGELLKLDDRLAALGMFVERRLGSAGFASGFVNASLIFSIGAMAIVGPIQDGLSGDAGILYIKSALDFTTSIVLASTLGAGVLFAAVPVLLVQGLFALLAAGISPFISDELLRLFSMVGYALVTSIGVNFLCETKIKTANLLPALLPPVLYYFIISSGLFA